MNDNKYEQVIDAYLALSSSHNRSNPVWHRMLRRVAEGRTAIVPVSNNREILWLVLQSDRKKLDEHTREIEAYMSGYCEPFSRDIHYFNDSRTLFSELCNSLYSNGYYLFVSSDTMEEAIASMLHLWIELDARRPMIRDAEAEVSSFTLRSRFHALIATSQWQEAQIILETIRQGRYVSDENYQFLKIQWLSSQNKWRELYFSAEFGAISQLQHIPTSIKQFLLFAYYDSELAQYDVRQDFHQGVNQYQISRYKITSVLNKAVYQGQIPLLRLMAYEAHAREDWSLLANLLSKSGDETSSVLISRLLENRNTVVDIPIEDQVGTSIAERRYGEAFEWLQQLSLSLRTMKWAAKIACMTESDEAFYYANTLWTELTGSDQENLLQDPDCKSDLKILLAWTKDKQNQQDMEDPSTITWNVWFAKLLHPDTTSEKLDKWLRQIASDQLGILWTNSALEELSELMMKVALENITGKQRAILETAFPILLSEIVTHERFPDTRAELVYSYLMELMAEHAKRNQTNSAFWLQLTEGTLSLDISKVAVQWSRTILWFEKIEPSKVMLQSLQGVLELFLDFGGPVDEISAMWMRWSGALGNTIATLEKDIVAGWIDLGRQMNVPADWIQLLGIEEGEETKENQWKKIGASQIAIFTLREAAALRAVQRLKLRNQAIKYTVVAVESLTAEAKAHAKHADFVVIVTACLSHALYYGIQPYVKDKTAYPRSSGSTGIVQAIEEYIENFYL